MHIKDNFVRGFVAGSMGGLGSLTVNVITSLLKLNSVMWLELMSLIILGRFPNTIGEYIFNLFIQIAFLGILGGVFALILPIISPEHLYFKGISYSAAIWFALFSLPQLLQLPKLKEVNLSTAMSNLGAAVTWGIGFIFLLKKLDPRN